MGTFQILSIIWHSLPSLRNCEIIAAMEKKICPEARCCPMSTSSLVDLRELAPMTGTYVTEREKYSYDEPETPF